MESNLYNKVSHYQGEKGEEYFTWQNSGKEFAAKIFQHKFHSYIKPTDIVVDFGCGGGQLLKALACSQRIGIEVNPIAREFTNNSGIICYESLEYLNDNSIDVIISHHALEHVEFPIGVLRQMTQKLKLNGTLVLCVPIDNWRLQNKYDPKDPNHHLHTWTTQLLGNTLFEAGFEDIKISYHVRSWTKRWTVFLYGRFPFWFFNFVSYCHGIITGKGRELVAVVKRKS